MREGEDVLRVIKTQLPIVPPPRASSWRQAVGGASQGTIERATEEFKVRAKRARFKALQGGRAS